MILKPRPILWNHSRFPKTDMKGRNQLFADSWQCLHSVYVYNRRKCLAVDTPMSKLLPMSHPPCYARRNIILKFESAEETKPWPWICFGRSDCWNMMMSRSGLDFLQRSVLLLWFPRFIVLNAPRGWKCPQPSAMSYLGDIREAFENTIWSLVHKEFIPQN